MAFYFDIIAQEKIEVDSSTVFYLIALPNSLYSLKAISEGLDQLPSDPYTLATHYWRVTLSNFDDITLFPNGVLREEPFSLEEVKSYFDLTPTDANKTAFNTKVKEDLLEAGNRALARDHAVTCYQESVIAMLPEELREQVDKLSPRSQRHLFTGLKNIFNFFIPEEDVNNNISNDGSVFPRLG